MRVLLAYLVSSSPVRRLTAPGDDTTGCPLAFIHMHHTHMTTHICTTHIHT